MENPEPISLPRTPKMRAFCEAYAINRNGTKAAISAGYSQSTASVKAWQLLQDIECKAYIDYLEKQRLAEAEISAVDILLELKKVAFANIGDFLSFSEQEGLAIKDFDDIPEDKLAAVSEFSESQTMAGTNRRFKLHSKLDAIAQLRALLGVDAAKKTESKISVEGGGVEKVAFSLKKRAADPDQPQE